MNTPPASHDLAARPTDVGGNSALAFLNDISLALARLDPSGRVVYENNNWRAFRQQYPASLLAVASGQRGEVAPEGEFSGPQHKLRALLQEIAAGKRESFQLDYHCPAASELRWYRLTAHSDPNPEVLCVMTQLDVTELIGTQSLCAVQAELAASLAMPKPALDCCRDILQSVCAWLSWDFGAVWIPTRHGKSLECADTFARHGSDGAKLHEFERLTRGSEIARGESLAGMAWFSGAPVWIRNVATCVTLAQRGAVTAAKLQTGLAVPMGGPGNPLAIVEFFSLDARAEDPRLLSLLANAGAQLGLSTFGRSAQQASAAAEQRAREAQGELKALLDCVPSFILTVDLEGRIRFINQVLPGHTKEAVIGSHWLDYVDPAERPRLARYLDDVLTQGIDQNYDTVVPAPDGNALCFSSHIAPIHVGNAITGAVVIAQDITATKRGQAELAEAQRLAAVGTLAAGIAHEINTPIQFVGDSIHFLRDATRDFLALLEPLCEVQRLAAAGASTPALSAAAASAAEALEEADLAYIQENVPKAFERALDGLARVATIVRAMKEFAHPPQSEMVPADLNRAIQSTLTIAKNEYKYVAEIETAFGDIPAVPCHLNEINQVVLNLVVNAAHAIGDVSKTAGRKGCIRVETRGEDEHVVVAISDTGPGIPEGIRARIFEPFFTTKEVGRGTGQGLALARSVVVDKHGGELTFETVLGQGTTFFIRLPISGKPKKQRREA